MADEAKDIPPGERLHPSSVIARGRGIRDVDRLIQTYGGEARRWSKRKGPRFIESSQTFEYHWYQCHGLGRFEFKRKLVAR